MTPALGALIGVVHLDHVRLVEASMRTALGPESEGGKFKLLTSHGAEAPSAIEHGQFTVKAWIDVKAVPQEVNGAADAVLIIRAVAELRYRVPEGFSVDEATARAFAENNGVFNAWPYFREFVQSATSRMGLPPIVLPVFRLTKPPAPQFAGTAPAGQARKKIARSRTAGAAAVRQRRSQ